MDSQRSGSECVYEETGSESVLEEPGSEYMYEEPGGVLSMHEEPESECEYEEPGNEGDIEDFIPSESTSSQQSHARTIKTLYRDIPLLKNISSQRTQRVSLESSVMAWIIIFGIFFGMFFILRYLLGIKLCGRKGVLRSIGRNIRWISRNIWGSKVSLTEYIVDGICKFV